MGNKSVNNLKRRELQQVCCQIQKRIIRGLHLNHVVFLAKKRFMHENVRLNHDQAIHILEKYSQCPMGKAIADNNLLKPYKYDLQIIIPAYNVEDYLRDCINSILNQKTKYKYKLVLIDDGSTDTTPQIVDEFAEDERVVTIHQKNKGIAGARNAGLNEIEAKYITFVDSDDMLVEGAIDTLLDAAFNNNAEIVQGSYYSLHGSMLFPSKHYHNRLIESKNNLDGKPWGKVFKSTLFKSLRFPEGFWFEDSICSFLIYPQVSSAFLISDYVYIYRQQDNSITHTFKDSEKCIDTYWITRLLMEEHEIMGLPNNKEYYEKVLRQILLNQKRIDATPIDIQKSVFCLSREHLLNYFPESKNSKKNRYLEKALKDNNFGLYCYYCRTH